MSLCFKLSAVLVSLLVFTAMGPIEASPLSGRNLKDLLNSVIQRVTFQHHHYDQNKPHHPPPMNRRLHDKKLEDELDAVLQGVHADNGHSQYNRFEHRHISKFAKDNTEEEETRTSSSNSQTHPSQTRSSSTNETETTKDVSTSTTESASATEMPTTETTTTTTGMPEMTPVIAKSEHKKKIYSWRQFDVYTPGGRPLVFIPLLHGIPLSLSVLTCAW